MRMPRHGGPMAPGRTCFWVCEVDEYEGIWEQWREMGIATFGYPPEAPSYDGLSHSRAVNRVRELHSGDRIVSYLKGKTARRVGGIGTFQGGVRISDQEYDPLYAGRNEQGRRVDVGWDSVPLRGYYIAVPDDIRTPARAQTIQHIPDDAAERLEEMAREESMWDQLALSKDLVQDEVKELHPRIVENLNNLESGLRLYDPAKATEFPAGPIGRIDVLAKDRDDCPVVVEAKTHSANEQVVGQILRYMGWVKKNLDQARVRGIIVAGEFTYATRYAASVVDQGEGLALYRYAVRRGSIEFVRVTVP